MADRMPFRNSIHPGTRLSDEHSAEEANDLIGYPMSRGLEAPATSLACRDRRWPFALSSRLRPPDYQSHNRLLW